MAQAMKVWRKKARLLLMEKLGNRCVDCGEMEYEKLEFDHIIPLSDEQQSYRVRIGSNSRIVMYRREAQEGLLAIRCETCNTRKAKAGAKQGTLEFSLPLVSRFAAAPF